MIPASNLIGIGITTKDRWDDLEVALNQLKKEGLDTLEILIIDDGSHVPVPPHLKTQFPQVQFLRFESSVGVIGRRNQLVRLLKAPFYLTLDDDSYPVAGDLAAAAAWMTEHPQVVALGFEVIRPSAPIPTKSRGEEPYPVRHFIGCACLIRCESFVALGGYDVGLRRYGEEPDFCMRAFLQGHETYYDRGSVFCHHVSQVSRNPALQFRELCRAETLFPLRYFPKLPSYLRILRFLPLFLFRSRSSRPYWLDGVKGVCDGIRWYLSKPNKLPRLSSQQFKVWLKYGLPTDPR